MFIPPGMMDEHFFYADIWGGVPNRYGKLEEMMAQNHYVTKAKRRQKSSKRKDPSAATMAKLRERAAAQATKAGK
jgi:hypothetical protein